MILHRSFKKVVDACHAEGAKVSVHWLQNAGPEEMQKMQEHRSQQLHRNGSLRKRYSERIIYQEVYELVKGSEKQQEEQWKPVWML